MDAMVSVIITTYNTSHSLKRAINSVLAQTYENIEIIVVDDNNPETKGRVSAEEIMREFETRENVKYLKHTENKNGAVARNTGIAKANGKYIAFLDDDDEFYPQRIERCTGVLLDNPDYSSVYTNVDIFKNDEHIRTIFATASGNAWKELILNESFLGTGSNLFLTKEAVLAVGGFDESFIRYQDVEFMLRVLDKYKIYALDETLVRKNVTHRNIPKYKPYRENKQKIFDKFSYLLDRLSPEDKTRFYCLQYRTLLNSAIAGANKEDIKKAKNELKSVRKLTFKEEFSAMFPKLIGIKRKIVNKIKEK